VAMADWQVGKGDGDGVKGTMDRLADMVGLVEDRWRDLRKIGVPLDTIYPCWMGDLRESCNGHYAQQQFRTTLNNRDQRKVIRWAVDRAVDSWARMAPQVACKVVGGNHGEERDAGKSHTDFADNVDVAVIEDVAYAYSKNPDRYGHVSWAIPSDDLTATFEHDGLVIGLAHGHQAGFGSGDPRTKIHNWWRGQMDGQLPIGDADVLVTGHYHHPWMIQRGKRTHIGCPALDPGSDWFRNQTGMDAPPGTMSFVVEGGRWHSLEILR
jgi:predicted phosphodiesterase